jgi:MFS family permease
MTTASLMGLAVSPVVAGFIGGSGLRLVFVADVLLLVVVGTLTWFRLRTKSVEHLEPLEPVEP